MCCTLTKEIPKPWDNEVYFDTQADKRGQDIIFCHGFDRRSPTRAGFGVIFGLERFRSVNI